MKCSPTPLKRNHYFSGQLLTAADFAAEQEYFLDRLRRHNRFCHGWGIVCGLDLNIIRAIVTVEPGMALDCAGNEIILEEQASIALPIGQTIQSVYVEIRYAECYSDQVPIYGAPCNSNSESGQYSRIVESYELKLEVEDHSGGHVQHEGRCKPCGTAHGVSLGRLRWSERRWSIDAEYRPYEAR